MRATTLTGHSNPIYSVISHPNENLFYTAGNDKGIVEWDINLKVPQRIFKGIKHTVYALEIIPNENLLIAGCNDGSICFFSLINSSLLNTIKSNSAVFHLKYNALKNELIASTDKGEILVIDPTNKKLLHQFQSGYQKVRAFDFHQNTNILATVSNDEMIRFYHLDDYTAISSIKSHENGVGSIAFTSDGNTLITGGRDAQLKIWDTYTWKLRNSFPAHLFQIYKIAIHPYLPYFATASRDKSIKIWRTGDYSLFKNLSVEKSKEGHILSVNDICWTNAGKNIISVGDDKLVKVWDFEV
ncbi:WD40 repeat domain-containing protein [Pedobacter alpinus]|uniref:WD40 repeat domain-containing protein n=1 Tax=Pedobacter alpinus TaxID=1590643 RepID=A0ABW5TUS6_9SPHI